MRLLILVFTLLSISSCRIYQVFETASRNVSKNPANKFSYENEDVKLVYNLWTKGGEFRFKMFNKTDNPIYIDWAKSNFIKNDFSKDYWKDVTYSRVISNTMGDAVNLDNINTSSYFNTVSVTLGKSERPRPNTQIPPHSAIYVNSFDISKYVPYGKNTAYPGRIEKLEYDSVTSPIKFRNYIGYSLSKNNSATSFGYNFSTDKDSLKFVDNSFWVNRVSIMTSGIFKKTYAGADTTELYPNSFYNYAEDKRRSRIVKGSIVGSVLAVTGISILSVLLYNYNH